MLIPGLQAHNPNCLIMTVHWTFHGFSSIQSLQLFATPQTIARQASLSITTSWSLLKLMSIVLVMPSNHLILCRPLLLNLSAFNLSQHQGLFKWVSSSQSGGQSIGVLASASVLSMIIQDWFPLEWTGSSYIPWVYSVRRYSMGSSHITWSKTNLSILFSTLVSSTLFMISLQEITIHSVTLTPNLESPQPGVNSSRSTSLLSTACKQPHGLGHFMFLESPIFPSPFKIYHPAKVKPHQQSHSLAQAMSWALLPFKSPWLNSKVGQGFKRMTISLPDYDSAVAPDHIMDDSKLLAENPNILHNPTCLPLPGAPTPCFPIVPCSFHTGPFFWAYNSSSLLNLNVGSSTQPSSFLRN